MFRLNQQGRACFPGSLCPFANSSNPPTALVEFGKASVKTRSRQGSSCRLSLNDPATGLVGFGKVIKKVELDAKFVGWAERSTNCVGGVLRDVFELVWVGRIRTKLRLALSDAFVQLYHSECLTAVRRRRYSTLFSNREISRQ
jgi:hypothetical protein